MREAHTFSQEVYQFICQKRDKAKKSVEKKKEKKIQSVKEDDNALNFVPVDMSFENYSDSSDPFDFIDVY